MPDPVVEFAFDGTMYISKEIMSIKLCQDIRRIDPDASEKVISSARLIFETAFDGLTDMAKSGSVSTPTLGIFIMKGTGAVFDTMSDDEKHQCFAALLNVAGEYASVGTQATALAATQYGTAGAVNLTPVAALQIALLAKSTIDAANAQVKANQQCGPLATKTLKSMDENIGDVVRRGENALRDFEEAIKRMVLNGGAGMGL